MKHMQKNTFKNFFFLDSSETYADSSLSKIGAKLQLHFFQTKKFKQIGKLILHIFHNIAHLLGPKT